ncbi:hypothetical protein D0817_12640 [Flavobacterium cupreum]|uniref:Sugar-binding protein n=1 Tax=Flavobacterium cupreum TaxID=2133766 RepID=A0A434A6Q8_9FLAO|nr:hypothetical protein [Flavobacterium cupreum]RUT70026.1 hypothetical protein D0817_12640 [Flavobacterium cupreum]
MKNKFRKTILVWILLIFTLSASAQGDYTSKMQIKSKAELNLKGPVKSVNTVYSSIKQDLDHKRKFRVFFENDVTKDIAYQFNTDGLVTKKINYHRDEKSLEVMIPTVVFMYEYEPNDSEEKKKFFPFLTPLNSFEVDNFVKTNQHISRVIQTGENGKNSESSGKKEYYYFTYKIENNKITEEKMYKDKPRKMDEKMAALYDEDEKPVPDNLCYLKKFIYDTKGNLVTCTFLRGDPGIEFESYLFDNRFNICRANLKYYYNDKNQLIKKSLDDTKEIFVAETYTYDPENSTVKKLNRTNRLLSYLPSDNVEYTYNENRDILETRFVTEDEINQPLVRYYEYEYDSNKNWIKCKMYLEGNKNEATAIAERKIEYFQ